MDEKTVRQIVSRIERLERTVFGSDAKPAKKKEGKPKFAGAAGGIQLLVSKGFFKQPRTAPNAREELAKNDYFYRIQVVQTALNRFSRRNGPLAAFKKEGKKVYVIRK